MDAILEIAGALLMIGLLINMFQWLGRCFTWR